MNKILSEPYEDMLRTLFLNKSLNFYFTKKNKDSSYLNNVELHTLIENCINDDNAFKELFSKFQWNSDIKFNPEFLNNNKLAISVKKQCPNFLETKYNPDISYHLTPEFYNKLPIKVQDFLLRKMLLAVNFRKGEHYQFKLEHLEKETLGSYYLFSLLVLQKEEHNNIFQTEFFKNILNMNNSSSLYKIIDFLTFMNKSLFPLEPDYLFIKNITPKIAQEIMHYDNINYCTILDPILSLSNPAIETFYEMYFTDLPTSKTYTISSILNKQKTPSFIKEKYKHKITISSDNLPTLDLEPQQNLDNGINITKEISFNVQDIEKLYNKFFNSSSVINLLSPGYAETKYNNESIRVAISCKRNVLDINLNYNVLNKDNLNNVYDFSEQSLELSKILIRSILMTHFEISSTPDNHPLKMHMDKHDFSVNLANSIQNIRKNMLTLQLKDNSELKGTKVRSKI